MFIDEVVKNVEMWVGCKSSNRDWVVLVDTALDYCIAEVGPSRAMHLVEDLCKYQNWAPESQLAAYT